MTTNVKEFLERNVKLLESNSTEELLFAAYHDLPIPLQSEIVDILQKAGIDITKALPATILRIIKGYIKYLVRNVDLKTFIARYVDGMFGFDAFIIEQFILFHKNDFNCNFKQDDDGDWWIVK